MLRVFFRLYLLVVIRLLINNSMLFINICFFSLGIYNLKWVYFFELILGWLDCCDIIFINLLKDVVKVFWKINFEFMFFLIDIFIKKLV